MAIHRDKVLETAQKLVEKKRYDKAVVELQRLIQEDPNDARTLLKIGDLQQKQGAHAEAIATYETVAKLYSHQGFALKAIAVYKQIREIIAKYVPHLDERYAHVAPQLAGLYQQLGLTSDALAALDEVATRLQRQQRDAEAIEVFRRIVAIDPTNPLPHLRLAEALSRARDTDGAVEEFKLAASQLVGIGRRDDALKVLERLLHHRPDPDQARICAELYLGRGQAQDGMQALSKLQICFQANPRDFDTLGLLARAFHVIGQGAKALEVQKEMARVARDTGRTDLFRELVERLVRLAPNDDVVRKLAAQADGQAAPAPSFERAEEARPGYGASRPEQPTGHYGEEPREELQSEDYDEVEADDVLEEVDDEEVEPAAVSEATDFEVDSSYEMSDEEMAAVEAEEAGYGAAGYGAPGYPSGGHPSAGYDAGAGSSSARAPATTREGSEDGDEAAIVQQVLSDADAYRRVGLFDRALQTIRNGLDLAPRAMELHEVYRDSLLEAGDTETAVAQMLHIASLCVDALDGEAAARSLQDVLAFDPTNARAVEMLQELGYEIVDENESFDAGASGSFDTGDADAAPVPSAPLPSFPLDEPFGAEAEAPAPATEATAASPHTTTSPPPSMSIGQASGMDLEDALDEAEFFCSRGLFDDAKAILTEQLSRHPNHPLLHERLAEVEQQQHARGSGTRERPRDEDAIDLASSLDGLEGLDDYAQPAEGFVAEGEQVDVEEVFAKFKEGVAKQISVDDSESHYNLGIAYKEMMLVEDAIREFEVAAMDPKRECVCRSMIGSIHLERGNLNAAIDAFLQGLNAPLKEPVQETMLCYEIGAAYEAKRMNKDALAYYQKAMRRDPDYRDVAERVRRLSKVEPVPLRQVAVGADDEFDRAFDDLLGGKG